MSSESSSPAAAANPPDSWPWWLMPVCLAFVAIGTSVMSYHVNKMNSLWDVLMEPSWSTDQYFADGSLANLTVVVTGANSGLGLYTSAKLYQKGARVIAGVRSEEKFLEAKSAVEQIVKEALKKSQKDAEDSGETVEYAFGSFEFPAPLDLAEPQSVEAFAMATLDLLPQQQSNHWGKKKPSFDILINNAGIMGTPRSYNSEGIERQMAVNHFGHAFLTNLLMPALLEENNDVSNHVLDNSLPRIVNHASSMHEFTERIRYEAGAPHYNESDSRSINPFDIYQDSKLANVLYTNALAFAAAASHYKQLTVVSCHPGWSHTNLVGRSIIGKALHLISSFVGMHPSKGAENVLRAALDPSVEPMTYVGPRLKGWGSPLLQYAKRWTYDIQNIAEFVKWSDRYMPKGTMTIPPILFKR